MNQYYINRLVAVVVFCVCSTMSLYAQDIHYTNFGYSPLNINPALTGAFRGDMRVTANYRSQWAGVPVGYSTFSGSFDTKFGEPLKHSPFRLGAFLSYDKAGDSRLNNTAIYLMGAYVLPISVSSSISGGLSIGGNQRAFRSGDLRFDDQYQNKQYSANNPTSESVFESTVVYADISAGVNYHLQKVGSRTTFDGGVGVFHLNSPKHSFTGAAPVQLEKRYNIYGSGAFPIGGALDLLLEGMYQWQGPHAESVLGAGLRLYLVQSPTKELGLQAGVTYRNGDAFIPHVGLTYNQWKVAINFDITTSRFNPAALNNGGPEFNLIYIFAKVPPAKYCPLCPSYL